MLTTTCRRFKRDRRGISNIIVIALSFVIMLAIVSNIVLWNYEMNQVDWEKMREQINVTSVESINQTSLYNPQEYFLGGETNLVSGNISNLTSDNGGYMNFESYYSGTNILDFIDNNNSNVDSSVDKGSQSNFTAQQHGPDSVVDVLVEQNTAGNGLLFLYVDAYDGVRTDWTRVGASPYLGFIDYNSNYVHTTKNNDQIGDFGFENSGISSETIQSVTIQLYAKQTAINNPIQLFVWEGSAWINLGSKAPTTSWGWIDYTATSQLNSWTKIDAAKIYLQTATGAGLYEVDCARLAINYVEPINYEIDLEVQWNNVDYNEVNEELCIYGGTTGSENIQVDMWNGSSWENLFGDLNPGWNNISVSLYLTSPLFTIRFMGENETNDSIQDSWEIDSTLLHVWTDRYTSEVEVTGSSNINDWNELNWTVDSAWTIGLVEVTLQLYNYTLDGYPISGNGYINYSSSLIANRAEDKNQTLSVTPTDFRNTTGYWKLKIMGVKETEEPFNLQIDWIEFKVKTNGSLFTFKNEGSLTIQVVSCWVNNFTYHERYSINLFVNSGDTVRYFTDNITLPDPPFLVKVATKRGNMAIFSES